MRRLSSFTSTELLYLAHKARKNIYTPEMYSALQRESAACHYSSCIAYAEDMRFLRLIKAYKEKKREQEMIMGTDRDRRVVSDVYTYMHAYGMAVGRPLGMNGHPSTRFSLHVQPAQASTRMASTAGRNKHGKQYYMAMSEDEKELDNFMDTLEENVHHIDGLGSNVHHIDSLDSNVHHGVRDTFTFVAEKVFAKKGVRDKNMWPSEFQAIVRKMRSELGLEVCVDEHGQLAQAVLAVLMPLQRCIFERRNVVKVLYFKKLVIAFYDFYKK